MKIYILLFLALIANTNTSSAQTASSYKNQKTAWDQHQQMRQSTPYKGISWRNIGPVFQGGRVVDIVKPTDRPHVLYVAYASGGVWISENNGNTFKPLTNSLPSQIVGSLAIDPNNSDILWLGTGENNSSRSSYGGMGVYRSTDAGKNWSYMGLGDTDRIGKILVDPKDSKRIFVAALGRLYSQGGDRGLYRSEDGGETWQTLIKGEKWTGFIDLTMSPNGDIYAAAWDRSRRPWNFVEGGDGSALYKSTDDGDNWQKLTNGLPYGKHMGRIGLDASQSKPGVIYAAIDNQMPLDESEWDYGDTAVNAKRLKNMSKNEFLSQGIESVKAFLKSSNFPPEIKAEDIIEQIKNDEKTVQSLVEMLTDGNDNLFNTDIRSLEIYRSDDAGESFYKTHQDDLQGVVFSYGYYFGQIRVDPQNEDVVYAMGVPLIKSTDGGKTWKSSWTSSVHVDFQELWINEKHSNHIIAGNDGGVDESFDGGKTWRQIDRQPVGQFYTIAVDMETPYNVYGGLQDNGTLTGPSTHDWTKGKGWKQIFGGDGMHINVDDDDKLTYVGFQFGNTFRLGSTAPKKITPPNFLGEESLRKNWNTPVMMSTHNKDILYFAGHKVYRSMNKGDDWTEISDDLTSSKSRGDVPFATITSLSESSLKFGLIWVGTDDGLVWVTNNSGNTWKQVNKKLPKGKWVSRITASPHDEKTAWLAFNNYRNDDIQTYLYKTENLGKSWQSISKGLPNEAINVVKQDPNNKNLVYVGTDKGIYVSLNQGESWEMLGHQLPTVPVHDLIVHPRENELVIGTHGRSVFIADITPLQKLNDEKRSSPLSVYPIEEITLKKSWQSKPYRWSPTDNKDDETSIYFWAQNAGKGKVVILDELDQVIFEQGIYLLKGINQWRWNYKVDQQLALQAEKNRNDSRKEEKPTEKLLNKAMIPFAESVRLGHPAFISAGKYQLKIQQAETHHSADFVVKEHKPTEH
ncbi:MAG: glycosyl hydrolase [Proteobacteria bacterium]|nr:glycosyl hydrolase [Pseudomonadota bacterium]